MAAGAVGIDPVDDPDLSKGGPAGCMAADPVFAVGDVCGLLEFWRLDLESLIMSKKAAWIAAFLLLVWEELVEKKPEHSIMVLHHTKEGWSGSYGTGTALG